MRDVSIWLILGAIIFFTALLGFFVGQGAARAEIRKATAEGVPWWPDKWQRLFWLLSPFLLTVIVIKIGSHYGIETGPLWAMLSAMLIIQAVVGGMFGFQFDLVSSVVCGVFIAVEYFLLGAFLIMTMPGFSQYFGWYAVIGILAIAAGAVLAAYLGSLRRR